MNRYAQKQSVAATIQGNVLQREIREGEIEMMKYIMVIIALVCGLILGLSPFLFNTDGVHPDGIYHAQWSGFILLGIGAAMGFTAITSAQKPKTD